MIITGILIMLITSCGSSIVTPEKNRIKEFPYLPSYENMKIENFEKSTTKEGLDHASITVKNTAYQDFLGNYEKLLHEEQWHTTDDKKPFSMTLEKDNHIVIIVVTSTEEDEDIKGLLYSK